MSWWDAQVMHVRIHHDEKRSWLSGVTREVFVVLEIALTEVEQLIIAARGLEDWVVLERFPSRRVAACFDPDDLAAQAPRFHLRVRNLLRGTDRFGLDTPGDAKAYELRLIEALHDLRDFLDANAELGDTMELDI